MLHAVDLLVLLLRACVPFERLTLAGERPVVVGGREEASPVQGGLQRSLGLTWPHWVSWPGRSWCSVEGKIEEARCKPGLTVGGRKPGQQMSLRG